MLKLENPAATGFYGNKHNKSIMRSKDNSSLYKFQDLFLCRFCAFYKIVQHKHRLQELCMFSGEKLPSLYPTACHFIPGRWENLPAILGLTSPADTCPCEVSL